jgi:hypothetical protein
MPNVRSTTAPGAPTSTTAPAQPAAPQQRVTTPATAPVPRPAGWKPAPIQLDKAKVMADFMAVEKAEKSNGDHLSFLDRGLASSPFKGAAPQVWESFGVRADGQAVQSSGSAGFTPFPARGEKVGEFRPLTFLGPSIKQAAIVVGSEVDGKMQARWYGQQPTLPSPMWSATKSLNALGLISKLNAMRPDLKVEDLSIRQAGSPGTAIPLKGLFQDITSYDNGPQGSNAGAGALGRMLGGAGREAFVEGNTGNDVTFNSNFGAGTMFSRPEIVTRTGERVLLSPESPGEAVKNRISAYDLTRVHAQAAWHTRLDPSQRLPGAQGHSIGGWMRAMTEDTARYTDAGLKKLGLEGKISNVAIASKLGFGFESGQYEAVYSAVVQFSDDRFSPPKQRSVSFTLRGEDASPTRLDAQLATDTTEILRRLVNDEL